MKWWFSDYDGTISVHQNEFLEEEDLNFIHEWMKKNKFVIATGRTKNETIEILNRNNLEFDYLITNNGAILYDKNENKLIEKTISMDIRKQLLEKIDILEGICGIKVATENDRLTLSGIEKEHRIENSFMFDHWYQIENQYKKFRNIILEEESLNNIAFYSYQENLDYIRNLFKGIPGIKILRTAHIVLEIMHEDVSKKLGIDYIQKLNSIKDENIITSGDGENDVEMLQSYEKTFAMEHGNILAKQAAKYQIKRVRDIKKFL